MKNTITKLIALCLILVLTACNQQQSEPQKTQSPVAGTQDTVKYIHVGPNWDALQKLDTSTSKFKISGQIDKSYKLGDKINATITSTRSGKLWVVFVDPNDEVSMMFPNKIANDNNIEANKPITIPGDNPDWSIQAGEPAGQTIVSFIVTTGNVDLKDVLNSGKQSAMKEALKIVDTSDQWSIQTHIVSVE